VCRADGFGREELIDGQPKISGPEGGRRKGSDRSEVGKAAGNVSKVSWRVKGISWRAAGGKKKTEGTAPDRKIHLEARKMSLAQDAVELPDGAEKQVADHTSERVLVLT